jgi:hypothetical protein
MQSKTHQEAPHHMSNKCASIVASIFLSIAIVSPALAQGAAFDMTGMVAASAGSTANISARTGSQSNGNGGHFAGQTTQQYDYKLHPVSTRGLVKVYGITGYQGLTGFGQFGGFGGGGPNFNDTYNDVAGHDAILAQEDAMAAQSENTTLAADSTDTNKGTGVTDSAAGF